MQCYILHIHIQSYSYMFDMSWPHVLHVTCSWTSLSGTYWSLRNASETSPEMREPLGDVLHSNLQGMYIVHSPFEAAALGIWPLASQTNKPWPKIGMIVLSLMETSDGSIADNDSWCCLSAISGKKMWDEMVKLWERWYDLIWKRLESYLTKRRGQAYMGHTHHVTCTVGKPYNPNRRQFLNIFRGAQNSQTQNTFPRIAHCFSSWRGLSWQEQVYMVYICRGDCQTAPMRQ